MEGYPLIFDLQPRFRDTDAMGHLNHAVFVTYLEVARMEYWARLTGSRDYDRVPFILAHVSVDYRSAAYVHETLRVGARVSRLGNRSFDAEYRIEDAASGRLVAEGRSVQIMYDYDTLASRPLTDEWRQRFRAFEGRADL